MRLMITLREPFSLRPYRRHVFYVCTCGNEIFRVSNIEKEWKGTWSSNYETVITCVACQRQTVVHEG